MLVGMATVQVRGTATEEVDPDRVFIACAAVARADTASAARAEATTIAERIRENSRALPGLRSLRLSRVSVSEVTHWDPIAQVTVADGWQATVGGHAEADASAASSVATVLVDAGGQIGYLEWSLDDDNPAFRRVRRAAVADAHRAAVDFADALGRTLGELVTLADPGLLNAGGQPMLRTSASDAGSVSGEQALEIDAEPVTVSASVEASYTLV